MMQEKAIQESSPKPQANTQKSQNNKQNTHAHNKKTVNENQQNSAPTEASAVKPNKPNNNRRRRGNKSAQQGGPSIEGNEAWQRDMKKAIDANEKMHKERLDRSYQIDQNSKGKIKITPLGGLGEIGGNICVFETETSAIVLDVGMSFPSEDMHGEIGRASCRERVSSPV